MKKVLITGARAPSALHLARLLKQGGCEVVLADSVRFPMGVLTTDGFEVLRYPSPRHKTDQFRAFILDVVDARSVDLVIPVCEEAVHLAEQCKEALGDRLATACAAAVIEAHSKLGFSHMLQDAGLPAPKTEQFLPGNLPSSDVVVKPVWSRFGEDVLFRPSKRDTDLLSDDLPWIQQELILGREICATAYCVSGQVVAFVSYEPRYRAGIGAGMYFDPVEAPELRSVMSRFADIHSWSGFLSFDAIEDGQGQVWPIECNPRGTSGIHLFQDGAAFSDAVKGTGSASPSNEPQAIKPAIWAAHFSKLLRLNADGSRARRDLRRAGDALSFDGKSALLNSVISSLELFLISVKKRISLISATTEDLIWEGDHAAARSEIRSRKA